MENKKMNVPLLDLKAQYKTLRDGLIKEVNEVMDSQKYILGPKVELFEKNVAEYCDAKYALGVSSGTDALLMSLLTLDINEGDEVILPPFTFFATGGIVYRAGAKIVFADIDPITYNIDPDSFEKAISPKTKAVIPVHLFGQCAQMDKIKEIATKNNIKVIEDAAQAVGSIYKGRRAGSLGDIGAFSCYPSKNLGAAGEAGFITTNDDDLYKMLMMARNHGQTKSTYYHKFVGGNFRMDGIQGAVLNHKLKFLDEWTEKRRENAKFYNDYFKNAGIVDLHISVPNEVYDRHIYHQYTISVKSGKRDMLRSHLNDKGIGSGIYYPLPLHLQPCFEYLGYNKGDFPVSENSCNEVLSLPVYPEMTQEMKDYVAEAIVEFFK
ncbi:MAG: DegT/DnrJ/EryC1/StrS family aminotransferase [Spirochaetota bacterium]